MKDHIISIKRCVRLGVLAFCTALSACGHLTLSDFDRRYGAGHPKEVVASTGSITYFNHVRPLLEQRCVVCHGCYDAPCQLKMDSYEGILRGAHKEKVYHGTRLLGVSLTRLFEDAQTTTEWRTKYFYPVINERKQTRKTNLDIGVLSQLLQLKQQHPLPSEPLLSDVFDLSLDRKQYCPRDDEVEDYKNKNPLWGMPMVCRVLQTMSRTYYWNGWQQVRQQVFPPKFLHPSGRRLNNGKLF